MTSQKASVEAARLVSEAMALPNDERTFIAVTLLESVEGPADPHAHLDDNELLAELGVRAQSVVDGTAETVSAEEVRADMKAIADRHRT